MAEGRTFTALGEPALEARVARDVSRLGAAVGDALGSTLVALLLGGGYGRGEGGGRRDGAGCWRPYNDYDLVAVVEGVPRWRLPRLRERLATLGRALELELGVEVELSPLRREELPSLPHTMMWCELLGGHRVVGGNPGALATAPSLPPSELPLVEGVRYLTNRGALLLWALAEAMPDERRWKFVHKAWLAVGAAVLISHGEFRVGYRARHEALVGLAAAALPPVANLVERHGAAVEARLRPTAPPAATTVARQVAEAVAGLLAAWQWLEERRTGAQAPTWEEYAGRSGLFAEPLPRLPLNALRHLRLLGFSGARPLTCLCEHPRTRVSRALPVLLAGRRVVPVVAHLLGEAGDWNHAALRCLSLWRRTN